MRIMNPILIMDSLQKRHPAGDRPFLFSQVSSSIFPQDSIALTGASGQGKTTLLRVLGRLEQADGGSMTLHGRPAAEWQPAEWRKRVCYVAQTPVMLPTTVEDNLTIVSKLHQSKFERSLALRLMEQAGLAHIDWTKKASELSGGERQRLQLVRSLLLRAEIYLLDEVTSSLDARSKHDVERMLMAWSEKEGSALVWITHDAEQAASVGKRTWTLKDGTLHAAGGSL
jgi:putative ABC transport system ATP-binding protein